MVFLIVLVIFAALIGPLGAAEETNPPPQAGPEQRRARIQELREKNPEAFDKMREELKNLTPEERQKRLREFREKHPAMAGPLRDELEKQREELKKLPPEERQAKIREKMAERAQLMTPEQRKAKRYEIRQRFENQLNQLREKKTNGTLTPLESKRLQRLETVEDRFKQAPKE
jgi:hypothetical protein